jgi:hypothetical protein
MILYHAIGTESERDLREFAARLPRSACPIIVTARSLAQAFLGHGRPIPYGIRWPGVLVVEEGAAAYAVRLAFDAEAVRV